MLSQSTESGDCDCQQPQDWLKFRPLVPSGRSIVGDVGRRGFKGRDVVELLVLFAHLLGVCVALGMIVLTDLRLLARVVGYQVVIPPPSRFERRVVSVALPYLYVTGGAMVAMHLQTTPDYLANPKMQGKLLLVVLLSLNALVLHKKVFPILERARRVADWSSLTRWKVALSVGLSNSLWLYCAFLGIARPWNNTRPLWSVLVIEVPVWLLFVLGVRFVLTFASRDEPAGRRDWLDSIKSTLSGISSFGELPGSPEASAAMPTPAIDRSRALPLAANEASSPDGAARVA